MILRIVKGIRSGWFGPRWTYPVKPDLPAWRYIMAKYRKMGFPPDCSRDWWEADHILPRIMGGDNSLENLRTLCVPCHKHETRALASKRAAERQDAKRPLLAVT